MWGRSEKRRARRTRSAPAERESLVVVGGGMTAFHFIESLISRDADERFAITLITEEVSPPYDRIHLERVVAGGPTPIFRGEDWYESHGIRLALKDRATRLDRSRAVVETESRAEIAYDHLVLATGSHAFVPPLEGADLPGVVSYRDVGDAERIAHEARRASHVTIVGGGLLGLELAYGVRQLSCEVDVVEMAPRLLPKQLDVDGASILERKIRSLGVGLRLFTGTSRISETEQGLAVELGSGKILRTDLVVFAVGTRPRDELARKADLDCHASGGVEVDDSLQTKDPKIFAIGEVARHQGRLFGFVAPCYGMAEALADRFSGGTGRFEGSTDSARLKVPGVEVAAVGESLADGTLVRNLVWKSEDEYRRVALRDGRLVGAIAVGASSEFPALQEAISRKARVTMAQERRFLENGKLFRGEQARPIETWRDDAIVCTCTGVNCGALREAWAEGYHSSAMLTEATGAGSGCGTCQPLLAEFAGEVTVGRRAGAGNALAWIAGASLAGLALGTWVGPIPMSTSVLDTPEIDFLWRDGFWKQVSGYSLVAVMAVAFLLPLRDRIPVLKRSSVRSARILHTSVGLATVLVGAVHTGLRLGANLNAMLMSAVLGLLVLGTFSAFATSLEHRLSPQLGSVLRRGWRGAHVALVWPLPLLLFFHVLTVYVY